MTMRAIFSRFARDDHGIAAVEFAFVAPVLVLLLVGMIDFGMYINQRMQLENLARSATEYVIKGGSEANVMSDVIAGSGQIEDEEMDEITSSASSTCECDDGVEVICGDGCGGGYERRFYAFELTRTYTPMFPYPGIPDSITMTGHARLQVQ